MSALLHVLLCSSLCLILSASEGRTEEIVYFNRFGAVTLYYDVPPPHQIILFVSGEKGWTQEAAANARALTSLGAVVAGIDLPRYLTELSKTEEACSYPGGDFDALSKFVQQKLKFPQYTHPVLVGFAAGAALAYATLAQAPPDMFQGVISLGFCPELIVKKPLCEWNSLKWRFPSHDNRFLLLPGTALSAPWIALHGDQDQVCSGTAVEAFTSQVPQGTLISVPQVGHEFTFPHTWLPQFQAALTHILQTTPSTLQADALADLPLVEVPATGPTADAFAVILSGDGGWASIDRELGDTFAARGVPVVGLNSLKYFWTRRTPEEAAKDLARILRHYLIAWRKDKALLIGYSLGADVLPFMVNRLPQELLAHTPLVTLLGPAHTVDFEFHMTDWFSSAPSAGAYAVLPEVQKLRAVKILCFYGEEEADTLCKDLDSQRVTIIRLKGGHHFDGNFPDMARTILREAGIAAPSSKEEQ